MVPDLLRILFVALGSSVVVGLIIGIMVAVIIYRIERKWKAAERRRRF